MALTTMISEYSSICCNSIVSISSELNVFPLSVTFAFLNLPCNSFTFFKQTSKPSLFLNSPQEPNREGFRVVSVVPGRRVDVRGVGVADPESLARAATLQHHQARRLGVEERAVARQPQDDVVVREPKRVGGRQVTGQHVPAPRAP